jgi:uncharacterized protein YdeI (YjbR/CyaY-like superfamily)
MPATKATTDLEVRAFRSSRAFNTWLAKNHARSLGIWLRFFKKGSGITSVTYAQALDEALCYGWIDGQTKSLDDQSWLQRFTPRRSRSVWSKRNVANVDRLTEQGRMKPAGLKQVETAKADGRWIAAYDSPRAMTPPEDLLQALAKLPKALAFYNSLNRANTYAIVWRLQTARKPETRQRRLTAILDMLRKGEKFH